MRIRILLAALAVCTSSAWADTIDFDATGSDNASSTTFYGISFTSGGAGSFLKSVTYTLPSGVYDKVSAVPSPNVGVLNGLALGDITFTPANGDAGPNGTTLMLTFAAGSFAPGDSIRFGFDIDGLVGTNSNAESHGIAGVMLDAMLESGATGSATFAVVVPAGDPVLPEQSTAQIVFGGAVPEPGVLALLAFAGVVVIRRRR